MSEVIGKEPDIYKPAVRAFYKNPGFRVEFETLAELRPAMVLDDIKIIDALANRQRRDALIRQELEAAGVEPIPALDTVLKEVARRYPYEFGLVELLQAVYPTIADETSQFQLYDLVLIEAVAARLNKAKQATVFKEDREEGLAPKRQAANKANAVAMAQLRYPDDLDLEDSVRDFYAVLVPATVAIQQQMFDKTYLLGDWDGIGFGDLDLVT